MKCGAIVEVSMKGRSYVVKMMFAKLAGFIPSALSFLLFQRESGFAQGDTKGHNKASS